MFGRATTVIAVLLLAAVAWFSWVLWEMRPHTIVTPMAYHLQAGESGSIASRKQVQAGRRKYTSGYSTWNQLTKEQQRILAPLAKGWDHLSVAKRSAVLRVAKLYPRMTKDQQQRFEARLAAWTNLDKQQKKAVRKEYERFAALPEPKQQQLKQLWLAQHREEASGRQ